MSWAQASEGEKPRVRCLCPPCLGNNIPSQRQQRQMPRCSSWCGGGLMWESLEQQLLPQIYPATWACAPHSENYFSNVSPPSAETSAMPSAPWSLHLCEPVSMVRSPRAGGAGGPDGRSLRQETPSRECNSLLPVLESCSEHTFQSCENLLVHFHVMASTWEAPSHLAASHTEGALLENLIFLTADAGFQSRCLRHVCSVCVVLWLECKQSQKVLGERMKALAPLRAL